MHLTQTDTFNSSLRINMTIGLIFPFVLFFIARIYVNRSLNGCIGVRRWHTNKNYSQGVAIIAEGGGWRRKPLHGKLIGWEPGRHDNITIPRFIAARRPSGRRLLLIFFFPLFFFSFFFGFKESVR